MEKIIGDKMGMGYAEEGLLGKMAGGRGEGGVGHP